MHNGVALADVAQELVAKARALTGTLYKARDIHELHDGRGLFIGLPDLGQLVQTLVRHGYDAAVRLDGAEGIVCGFCVLGGDVYKRQQLLRSAVFTSVPMNSYYGNYNCSWPPAQVQPATFSYPNMDFSSLIQQDDAQISFQALITP